MAAFLPCVLLCKQTIEGFKTLGWMKQNQPIICLKNEGKAEILLKNKLKEIFFMYELTYAQGNRRRNNVLIASRIK